MTLTEIKADSKKWREVKGHLIVYSSEHVLNLYAEIEARDLMLREAPTFGGHANTPLGHELRAWEAKRDALIGSAQEE